MQSNPLPAHKGLNRSLFAVGAVLLSATAATLGTEGVPADETNARLEIRSIVADGAQSLTPQQFADMMKATKRIAAAVDREM